MVHWQNFNFTTFFHLQLLNSFPHKFARGTLCWYMVSTRVLSLGDHTFYLYLNFYLHCYLDSSWGTSILKKKQENPWHLQPLHCDKEVGVMMTSKHHSSWIWTLVSFLSIDKVYSLFFCYYSFISNCILNDVLWTSPSFLLFILNSFFSCLIMFQNERHMQKHLKNVYS